MPAQPTELTHSPIMQDCPLPFAVIPTSKSVRGALEGTDWPEFLEQLRQESRYEFRKGRSVRQKTPHCYESFIFSWAEVSSDDRLQPIYKHIAERKY